MCTLLQAMMLLDNRYEGYEFSSISADEIMRYAASIKNNYSEEQRNRLYDIIDYLEKVFPEKDKMLKKINIPIVMLAADTAMGDGYDPVKNLYRVGPMYFRQWFSYFFAECYEEYKQYCSSGSIKKEKTLKRIEIMESSLVDYFELEEADKAEQDTALSQEDASVDEPALTEKDSSPEEPAPTDDSEPSMEASLSESAVFEEDAGYASASEDTASYTASDQTKYSETSEVEEPPEDPTQDTD